MTTAKNAVLIGLYLENCCLVRGGEGGGILTFGGGYKNLVWAGMSKFLVGGGISPMPPSPQYGKPCMVECFCKNS